MFELSSITMTFIKFNLITFWFVSHWDATSFISFVLSGKNESINVVHIFLKNGKEVG